MTKEVVQRQGQEPRQGDSQSVGDAGGCHGKFPMLITCLRRAGSRGEASVLATPAQAFPREASPRPRPAGADLQGDVVEGVHVGSPSEEPLIQNDQEDEVDAGQEVQPHVHQQEGQVEALGMQVEGGLSLGPEAAIPSSGPWFWEILRGLKSPGQIPTPSWPTRPWDLGWAFSLSCPSTLDVVGLSPNFTLAHIAPGTLFPFPHFGFPGHHCLQPSLDQDPSRSWALVPPPRGSLKRETHPSTTILPDRDYGCQ